MAVPGGRVRLSWCWWWILQLYRWANDGAGRVQSSTTAQLTIKWFSYDPAEALMPKYQVPAESSSSTNNSSGGESWHYPGWAPPPAPGQTNVIMQLHQWCVGEPDRGVQPQPDPHHYHPITSISVSLYRDNVEIYLNIIVFRYPGWTHVLLVWVRWQQLLVLQYIKDFFRVSS